jgi:DNA-binding FrmR family transcriptional regulator
VSAHAHSHAPGDAHGHEHDPESIRRLVNRLSRIEGHVRGIKVMLQEERPCPEVLTQIAAIRGALDKVARILLHEHLTSCVTRAAQAGSIQAEIDALEDALDHFI